MMKIETRKALMSDIEDLVEIESSAIPGYGYVYDDRFFFLEEEGNTGEMTLSLMDDKPVGMGQFSLMPDGSGWLECLRVRKEYQRQGVGNSIYKRYMELAKKYNCPSLAMFTGWGNVASRGLAEVYGFKLAQVVVEYSFDVLEDAETEGFYEVKDVSEVDLEPWARFMAINRTFMHYGEELYRYLIDRHMIFSDGENMVVVGCRMLEERGWFVGCLKGDVKKCLNFAKHLTYKKGLKKLTVSFPPERTDLREVFSENGFVEGGELIVMERDMNS